MDSVLIFPSLLSLVILLVIPTSFSATALSTTTTTTHDNDDSSLEFIRSSCNTTFYPDLCYSSLSRYAHAAYHNPARLARFAIGTALIKTHQAAAFISNITHRRDDYSRPDLRAASALNDCSSTLEDAVGKMRGSLKEITKLVANRKVGSATTESVRFQVSNVKTWMSSALTNEDTCSDGFSEVEDSNTLKKQVCNKVGMVKDYTANALALVNNFAASLT